MSPGRHLWPRIAPLPTLPHAFFPAAFFCFGPNAGQQASSRSWQPGFSHQPRPARLGGGLATLRGPPGRESCAVAADEQGLYVTGVRTLHARREPQRQTCRAAVPRIPAKVVSPDSRVNPFAAQRPAEAADPSRIGTGESARAGLFSPRAARQPLLEVPALGTGQPPPAPLLGRSRTAPAAQMEATLTAAASLFTRPLAVGGAGRPEVSTSALPPRSSSGSAGSEALASIPPATPPLRPAPLSRGDSMTADMHLIGEAGPSEHTAGNDRESSLQLPPGPMQTDVEEEEEEKEEEGPWGLDQSSRVHVSWAPGGESAMEDDSCGFGDTSHLVSQLEAALHEVTLREGLCHLGMGPGRQHRPRPLCPLSVSEGEQGIELLVDGCRLRQQGRELKVQVDGGCRLTISAGPCCTRSVQLPPHLDIDRLQATWDEDVLKARGTHSEVRPPAATVVTDSYLSYACTL